VTHPLDRWLDARTSADLRSAWTDLAPTIVDIAPEGSTLTGHSAAYLAHDMLGVPLEDLAWLATQHFELNETNAPTLWSIEQKSPSCFLELSFDVPERCRETWYLRGLVHGDRGLQHLTVNYLAGRGNASHGSYETVIRIFDRSASLGISVMTRGRTAAVIAPEAQRHAIIERVKRGLDLLQRRQSYEITSVPFRDPARARELLAELASLVEPAFASSATWPSAVTDQRGLGPPDDRSYLTVTRSTQGPFAIEVEDRDWQGGSETTATAHGLAWGWHLAVVVDIKDDSATVRVDVRLPRALGDLVLARVPAR
jgi:hypothetical protein